MGIFARFFFGLETYSQIFMGGALALIFLGLFPSQDFWERQLGFVFNSDSSRCLGRWLAYLIVLSFSLFLILSFHFAKKNIKTLEKLKGLRYVTTHCRHVCLYHNKHRRYLSDSSLLSLAWFSWIPLLFLYFGLTNSVKYSNNQLNLIKYSAQFRKKSGLAIKASLYLLVNLPIILSAWVRLPGFWSDFVFKFVMALVWVVLYRFGFPLIKKKMDIFVNSDMFAPWMLENDEEKTGLI